MGIYERVVSIIIESMPFKEKSRHRGIVDREMNVIIRKIPYIINFPVLPILALTEALWSPVEITQ